MKRARYRLLTATLAVVFTSAFLQAGCSLVNGDESRSLVGTTWRLRAFLADDELPAFDDAICSLDGVDCVSADRTYTVTFQDNGEIGAQADCNTCGGSYERDGRALDVKGLACTRMGCGEASRGAAFAQALGAARGFRIRDGWLLIAHGDGQGLLLRATSSRSQAPSPSR